MSMNIPAVRQIGNLVLLCLVMGIGTASADSSVAPDKSLLVVGIAHFSNPGRDVANTHVDDMLVPQRQAQIAALAKRLALFHPTHVAVEWPHAKQAGLDERYRAYREGRYTLTADEVDQLGLRVAAMLNLPRVDAVDWNDHPPGQEDEYDYERFAEEHGQQAQLDAHREVLKLRTQADSEALARSDIGDWLYMLNDPRRLAESHRGYFDIALLGDDSQQPGANWVGSWYGRNLRILNNLRMVADRPGDKVLAIYGAGHAFLLEQLAAESGVFKVAPAQPYLKPRR